MKNLRVYAGSEHPHEAQQPDRPRRRLAERQEQKRGLIMAELNSLEKLGASVTAAEAAPEAPVHEPKVDDLGRSYATGKRKDAIARVWIKRGTGKITVNGRDFEKYFARPCCR
jgi:hypothetical protein